VAPSRLVTTSLGMDQNSFSAIARKNRRCESVRSGC